MKKKRTALIVNLMMGTFYIVLSAVLFLFTDDITELSSFMLFYNDKVVYSVGPEDKYEPVPKDSLFTPNDYDGITLYYARTSTKWHLTKECQYLRNSKVITSTDYDTAVSLGLSACSKCGYPDERPD